MVEVLFVSAFAFDSLGHLRIFQKLLIKMFAFYLIFICFLVVLREQNACLTHPDRSAMAGLLLWKIRHPKGCSSPAGRFMSKCRH